MRELQEVGARPGAVFGVPTMGVSVALLEWRRHSMLELHTEQPEVGALTAKRMKRRPWAVGQQWGGMDRTSVTTSKRSCVAALSEETARKHAKSRKASRENRRGTRPWRGRGTSPQAGLATDGKKCRSGAAALRPRTPRSLATQVAWNCRASQKCTCSGTEARARVTVVVI